MSYTLTPGKFLRHLAIAYRKHGSTPVQLPDERKSLKKQLGLLEKKYGEMLLEENLDTETVARISGKIEALKGRL